MTNVEYNGDRWGGHAPANPAGSNLAKRRAGAIRRFHADDQPASGSPAAPIIARMPARIAAGSVGHAATIRAKPGSP